MNGPGKETVRTPTLINLCRSDPVDVVTEPELAAQMQQHKSEKRKRLLGGFLASAKLAVT